MKKLFFTLSLVFVFFLSLANYSFAQQGTVSATVRPNPLAVEVFAPSGVTVGQWFEVKAEVSNLGMERIGRISATLNTSPELNVRGSEKKNLGSLPSGGTKTVKWRVKVDSSGNYITTVEAKGKLLGEEISASDSVKIFATGSLSAFFFRLIFGG